MLKAMRLCRPGRNAAIKRNYASSTKINNTFGLPSSLPLATQLLNQRLITQPSNYATAATTDPEATLDNAAFENICEETLDGLTEYFEELVELDASIKEADISYSSGVLTLTFGTSAGTYVINKQSPNKQIWLSSPTSGPKRFDFDVKGKYWIYRHTGETLHQLLQAEMPTIFKIKDIDFSRCCYSKL